jgi:4-amino-4-deoxy-L-arabinose transferase-like glycosyltransferase
MSRQSDCVAPMLSLPGRKISQTLHPQKDGLVERFNDWSPLILSGCAILVLFYQLGSAALFEPDEGRNAEKAREILVLRDWITPHENFHPVLDKPIFFYWLIAFCYKMFGVSEGAARLPSAFAALGCLGMVYYFTRVHWGKAQALWSGLILLGCVEFFVFARLVIFDMTLTLCVTLSLCCFYQASQCVNDRGRKALCCLMYSALGVGTLIKGLIAVVIPGMVIAGYLLLTRKWPVLRRIYLFPGALLFFAIVLPWYLQAGALHEGYLRYFFWDEHFGRFTSNEFNRSEPWYYFIIVALVGFCPWTLLWPFLSGGFHRKAFDDKTWFLILWAGLPLLFFSASRAKLPHYILPIFPALAMLTASRFVTLFEQSSQRARRVLSLTWLTYGSAVLYLMIGRWQPAILPRGLTAAVFNLPRLLWLYAALITLGLCFFFNVTRRWKHQPQLYLAQCAIMTAFSILVAHAMSTASLGRSAKLLADYARPFLTEQTQVALYDAYVGGLGFYLAIDRPLWVITEDRTKQTFIGNYYVLSKREDPQTRWGKVIFDAKKFAAHWRAGQQRLLVLSKLNKRARLEQQLGAQTKVVASVNDYVWLVKN